MDKIEFEKVTTEEVILALCKSIDYLRSENKKLRKIAEAASDVLPYLKDNNTLRARQIESALKELDGEK